MPSFDDVQHDFHAVKAAYATMHFQCAGGSDQCWCLAECAECSTKELPGLMAKAAETRIVFHLSPFVQCCRQTALGLPGHPRGMHSLSFCHLSLLEYVCIQQPKRL